MAALELSPPSSWPDDEHALCPPPCHGLMVFDAARGELRCDECGLRAEDAAARQKVAW
jgi:thymidylate synthase